MDFKDRMIEAVERGYAIEDGAYEHVRESLADRADMQRKRALEETVRNPPVLARRVHFEFTVLDGVAELFATNSLALALKIIPKIATDLTTIRVVVQPEPLQFPRVLTYEQACEKA